MNVRVRRSSGNVFRDLGFSEDEAENLKIRADLMIELTKLIEAQALTQAAAAKLLGVTQPRVSDLMRGKIDRFSVDTLIEMLGHAGASVSVVVAPRSLGEAIDEITQFSKKITPLKPPFGEAGRGSRPTETESSSLEPAMASPDASGRWVRAFLAEPLTDVANRPSAYPFAPPDTTSHYSEQFPALFAKVASQSGSQPALPRRLFPVDLRSPKPTQRQSA